MDITSALDWGQNKLKHLERPRFESEVLLMAALGKDRVFLKTHDDYLLEAETLNLYKNFVQKRVENLPTAYILGHVHWCGLDLVVNESVLIPRDETETLVHHILKTLTSFPSPVSILDLGTGSGAIALALAKERQVLGGKDQVLGVDVSNEALEVAQTNASRLGLSVSFVQSDMLSSVEKKNWDIIVANLPYVPSGMNVTPEVLREPSGAIFSGIDGLDHYRALKTQIKAREVLFKALWLEHLPTQKEALEHIFKDYQITFKNDVSGQPYFAMITCDLPGQHTPE